MTRSPRVVEVNVLGPRFLRVVFSDGLVRELNFTGSLPGVLATIDDDVRFAAVSIDPVAGTLTWEGGIDFDPDVLHGDHASAAGHQPRVVREYRLTQVS